LDEIVPAPVQGRRGTQPRRMFIRELSAYFRPLPAPRRRKPKDDMVPSSVAASLSARLSDRTMPS